MRFILLLFLALAGYHLQAQDYTWFRAGIGYTASKLYKVGGSAEFSNTLEPSGAFYNFNLRKEISEMISIETGFMERGYHNNFSIDGDKYGSFGSFESYQIPLKIYLDLNLYRERILMFTSFGYTFCIEGHTGSGLVTSTSIKDTVVLTASYSTLPESKYHSLFSVSTGARIRIIEELLIELELGYAFGFEDLRRFEITYYDDSGVLNEIYGTDRGRYWFLGIRLSYPLERVLDIVQIGLKH
ncbi:MAG: hypothetical protein ACOCWA_02455 [Bacteroidota bacterium]